MTDYLSLVAKAANADEVWEEHHFLVFRGNRSLDVTLSDQGPGHPDTRYSARAQDVNSDKIVSHGNPDPTPEGALDNVHWWQFD